MADEVLRDPHCHWELFRGRGAAVPALNLPMGLPVLWDPPQAPAAGPACTRAARARPQGWSSLPELSSVLLLGSAGFSPHKISVSSLLHCTALEPFACVCSYSLQGPSASFSSSCILSSTGHAPDKWPLLNAGFRGEFSKWQQVLGIPVSSEELFS